MNINREEMSTKFETTISKMNQIKSKQMRWTIINLEIEANSLLNVDW